ncbi:MAG: hypothetical protein H6721_09255, partial [Sandaracinus sp.]|nr:hypothetical protein [Sandaracinus sp.]
MALDGTKAAEWIDAGRWTDLIREPLEAGHTALLHARLGELDAALEAADEAPEVGEEGAAARAA